MKFSLKSLLLVTSTVALMFAISVTTYVCGYVNGVEAGRDAQREEMTWHEIELSSPAIQDGP